MSSTVTPAPRARRVPIVVLAIVAIAAGLVAGRAHSMQAARPVAPVDAAQLPAKRAFSTAWYCPGLPATFASSDQTLTLSNFGTSDADAVVTVHPDDGAAPVAHTLTVPHDSVRSFSRATLAPVVVTGTQHSAAKAASTTHGALPDGPLVVEPFSPDVVVSAGLESSAALSTVPCATAAATDWYFAAGTTLRGVSQWLVLQNPFAADARVDVTLRTDAGVQMLPALSGLDVPGRSRVIVPIHNEAVRRPRVAVEVHADVGRIVAAQTLQYSSAAGTPGVATSIGAVAPASEWWFADGDTRAGASEQVAIADIGELDARVNVEAQVGHKAIVRPIALTVPSGGVSWVQIGDCSASTTTCLDVPNRSGYVLIVQSDSDAPIVAQTLTRFDGEQLGTRGAATSMGSTNPARQWVIPRTRAAGSRSMSIAVTDPGIHVAHVSVAIVHAGRVDRPATLRLITIAPGARFVVPFGADPAFPRVDTTVVLSADVPIFAESTIYTARDVTRAPGVPSR